MTRLLSETKSAATTTTVSGIFVWMCGVILPTAAILFEALTAMAASFIDPMPTLWHLLLLITVPVCNVLAWWGLKSDNLTHARRFAAMSGYSAAVSLFYAILFVPIMPMAAIGLFALLPVLAFAPALSFVTSLRLIRDWKGFVGGRSIVLGFAAGFAALVLTAWPAIGMRLGAGLTHSETAWVRDLGNHLLRLDGVREELLEACHSPSTGGAVSAMAFVSGSGPLPRDEAQRLYYRVTGKAYEQEPPATLAWRRRAFLRFDDHRGGDRVGPPGEGVRLASSRLDGRLEPQSATGYFEWTMVFRNSSRQQQEARMEMALPRGAVASRASLWIHGAEREAAFGERAQVRQAYERVVRQRRDPLLVTTSGPDRVLVQCFPIEPSGEMKIRVGITAPIPPDGIVALPTLLSQNFDAADPAWVWIEPRSTAAPSRLRAGERAAVRIENVYFGPTWATESEGKAVEQRFVSRTVEPPQRVVVVVDASESMRTMQKEIRDALATMPKSVDARVVEAGAWRGGVDAVPALEEAFPATVLWIAGDQPVSFAGTERIRQVLERSEGRQKLFVLATGGTNVILRDLQGLPGVEMIPRAGAAGEDLRRFLARWHGPYQEQIAERRVVPADKVAKDAERGSSHIVRLWAAGQPPAVAIAHQVVTPRTGAVVLETAAQYTQNGLQPTSPSTVPTMPEPETYGLIAIGLTTIVIVRKWGRPPGLRGTPWSRCSNSVPAPTKPTGASAADQGVCPT